MEIKVAPATSTAEPASAPRRTRERVRHLRQMFRQAMFRPPASAPSHRPQASKMTLYRCFRFQEELVVTCMDHWEATFRQGWGTSADQYPKAKIRPAASEFSSPLPHELVSQPGHSGNVFHAA